MDVQTVAEILSSRLIFKKDKISLYYQFVRFKVDHLTDKNGS